MARHTVAIRGAEEPDTQEGTMDSASNSQDRHGSSEIRACGVLEDDDLVEAQTFGGLSRTGKTILLVGVAAGAVAMVAQIASTIREEGLTDDLWTSWMAATVISAVVFVLALVALRWQSARRRSHRVTGAEVEYVVRSDGLEFRDPWSRAHLPWSAFSGWDETERSFWFYQGPEICRVLPLRFLEPGDADRLRMWLRQLLGEPGIAGAVAPGAVTPSPGHESSASTSPRRPASDETEPVITCAGVPEHSEWWASRPALERAGSRFYAGALITIVACGILLGAIVLLELADDPELRRTAASLAPAVVIAGIMLFFTFRHQRAVRRAWAENGPRMSYRLTPQGLYLELRDEVVDLAWADLESWRENRHAFVFVLGGGRWYFLPWRFLDRDQRGTLRSWLDDRNQSSSSA